MQFFDVLPQAARVSLMTTKANVIINIPADIAKQVRLQPDDHLQLRYGRDGDVAAIQIVKSPTATAWRVKARKSVWQVFAGQILPKDQYPRTMVKHEIQNGHLTITLPTTWALKREEMISSVPAAPLAAAPKVRAK